MMPGTKTKKQPKKNPVGKTSTKKATSGRSKQTVKKKPPAKKAVKTVVKKTSKTSVSVKEVAKKTGKKKDTSNGERKYVLDPVLVINNAHTMHEQLMALINAKKNVVIDASAVEMADTSILQLLLAFVKKLHAEDLKVTWINPSNELLSRAKILDLTEKLGLTGS